MLEVKSDIALLGVPRTAISFQLMFEHMLFS